MSAPPAAEHTVTIVKYGHRDAVRSDVYLNYQLYGTPDAPIGMDYFFWIIQDADGRTILVDTGFSERGARRRGPTGLVDPVVACQHLGISPESVTEIILTHAHYDHAGNVHRFPNATITMARAELGFWTSQHPRRAQFLHHVEADEIAHLGEAAREGRVRLIDGDTRYAPGIDLIHVGGHTPGLFMVRVATSDGDVLLTSDATHYYEEYEHDLPFTTVVDILGMYEGFDAIRALEADGLEHVVCGHDPGTFERFAPEVDGPLAGLVARIGSGRMERGRQ